MPSPRPIIGLKKLWFHDFVAQVARDVISRPTKKVFSRITELKSGNYGYKSSPIETRVTLNKEKR